MKSIKSTLFVIGLIAYAASFPSAADQNIMDDLIVQGSLCVGSACEQGEGFEFDTIRLKGANPQINFQDTSGTSHAANDWIMGYDGGTKTFFVTDVDAGKKVLQLEAGENGGIALGADASIEADAVSVGAEGRERKIVNVDDGTDDNDAVTVKQFNAFKSQTEQSIDNELAEINTRIDELTARLEALVVRVDQLTP